MRCRKRIKKDADEYANDDSGDRHRRADGIGQRRRGAGRGARAGLSLFGQRSLIPFGRLAGLARGLDGGNRARCRARATVGRMGEHLGCALFGRNHCVGGRGCEPSHSAGSDRQYGLENRDGRGFAPSAAATPTRLCASARLGRGWARYGQRGLPRCFGKNLFDRRCTNSCRASL